MDAYIRVAGGDEIVELGDLWEWLRRERMLTGHARALHQRPGHDELGGAIDAIAVALGSGSTAAVLARSLTTWIKSRRASVVVKVTTSTGTVELDAHNVNTVDVLPLLQQAMHDDV